MLTPIARAALAGHHGLGRYCRTSMSMFASPTGRIALPAGEIGEVLVHGDVVMKGYWRDAAASAATLRGGWLHTGDMGAFDDEGFLP